MAEHYLGEQVGTWTNHIINPDFAIDASYWAPLDSHTTITVVDGRLKVDTDGLASGGIYGVVYTGPPILTSDINPTSVDGYIAVNVGTTATTTPYMTFGAQKVTAGGAVLGTFTVNRTVYTIPRREGVSLGSLSRTLADYIMPYIRFVKPGAAAGTFWLDSVMITGNHWAQTTFPDFISGSRPDGEDGLNYSWTGTPGASTSIATPSRVVDIPETGSTNDFFTITGSGFIPNEKLWVVVYPEVNDETALLVMAEADGTLNYTFWMPSNAVGANTEIRVRVKSEATSATFGYPYAAQTVNITAGAPPAPEPLVNHFPNPDLRTTTRTEWILGNDFPNPSPTRDLTHWTAVSGGSITRTPAASLFSTTTHGARVVNGVNLACSVTDGYGRSVTVKVRAAEAMTITGTATADFNVEIAEVGWGNFGWGEETTYVQGASKVFAAGEECLFRIYFYSGSGYTGPLWHPVVTLTGTGTFDVDGVMEWVGVDNGVDLPDGSWIAPPCAPLFFDGDTPAANGITYGWIGTPGNSPSASYGQVPKYLSADYDMEFTGFPEIPSSAFATTFNGEPVVASRSAIGFGLNEISVGDGNTALGHAGTFNGFDLVEGKSYVFTYDIVAPYRNSWQGYWEPQWGVGNVSGTLWQDRLNSNSYQTYQSTNGTGPYRARVVVPFVYMADGLLSAGIDTGYMNWSTGETYLTNFAILPVEKILIHDGSWSVSDGTKDLMALGVEAGKAYHLTLEWIDENAGVRVQYQVGAGPWITLAEENRNVGHDGEIGHIVNASLPFTVPAEATAVRFHNDLPSTSYSTVNLTTAVPEFFDGDTPDGGGFAYSWTGTPYDSPSIRTAAATGPSAQVFVGGTAKAVAEMRVATAGGILVPVTQAGD